MKRIGVLLSAGPGGGVLQYTQAILDAVMTLPAEYTLTAAFSDPSWHDHLSSRVSVVKLEDTKGNRALNRAWHTSGLSMAAWRNHG